MSDDEEYYDDEDYIEWEDGPLEGVAADADDLAEHAVHSPVWQDRDPADDRAEYWSDWDAYTDLFYDHESGRAFKNAPGLKGSKKRKRGEDSIVTGDQLTHNQKVEPQTQHTGFKQAALRFSSRPPVLWRISGNVTTFPTLDAESSNKVALLSDWRTRFPPDSLQESTPVAKLSKKKSKSSINSRSQKANRRLTKQEKPIEQQDSSSINLAVTMEGGMMKSKTQSGKSQRILDEAQDTLPKSDSNNDEEDSMDRSTIKNLRNRKRKAPDESDTPTENIRPPSKRVASILQEQKRTKDPKASEKKKVSKRLK